MSSPPAGSTKARPVIVEDDEQSFQERLLALEERETRVAEAEKLARDSGCRILMDGKMVPVFTLEAEASCASLEEPVALVSKEELQRVLLRICSISEIARDVATEMLLTTTTGNATPTVVIDSKRKATHAETVYRCSHCKLRFETDANLPQDCRYQSGRCYQHVCSQHILDIQACCPMTPQVARRLRRTSNDLTTMWNPITTTAATATRVILPMSRIMRGASNGPLVMLQPTRRCRWLSSA